MKTWQELIEAKLKKPKGKEAKRKAELTKGLRLVTKDEYWSPENIRKVNDLGGHGWHETYDKDGNPLFKGNADWSAGKWRTSYDITASRPGGNAVAVKITQMDEKNKMLAQEWWVL